MNELSTRGKSGVSLYVENRQLDNQIKKVFSSDERFEIVGPDDKDRHPELVLFSLAANSDHDVEKVFGWIEKIANREAESEIFLFSDSKDPEILVRAMRSGVREFLTLPLDEEEFANALGSFRKRQLKLSGGAGGDKQGKIVIFVGAKGGTGVTTVAVNLGVGLAKEKSVVLVDMNQLFGEIPQFLDIESRFTWYEIIRNINRIDSALLMDSLSRHKSGVYVLPSPAYLSSEVLATPEIMERLLRNLQRMFDYILVDAGQTLDPVALKLMQISDIVSIVSILSVTCLSNTHKLLATFKKLGYPELEKVKVIVNRYIDGSTISVDDAESVIDHELFWKIPNDYARTMKAINSGKPFMLSDPKSKISASYGKLIEKVAGGEEGKKKKWWSLGR